MKKILIISHNVFDKTSNMGKTLVSYFASYPAEKLAQFYIHSEVPTSRICENYYRVTDKEMISAIFTRKSGHVFSGTDIQENRDSSRTDTGVTAVIYQKSRKRTPLIYLLRNILWSLGAWNTKELKNWVDAFAPDAVFFASGDYGFMYRIARKIAKRKGIPLFVCCMDDYYINNKNSRRFLGKTVHRCFMMQVRRTMAYATCLFSICDKMSQEYSKMFDKPSYTLHTAASFAGPLKGDRKNKISYIGNLGYNRHLQLKDIGKALCAIQGEGIPQFIDVYSAESRPEILAHLTEENGIRFHGAIDADQVRQVMAESKLLIHTESFDDGIRKSVAYSVSTKIADSLASGTCLLAYGPEEIASIQYLKGHNAAFCITDARELEPGLRRILTDDTLRSEIIGNALELAKTNHSADQVEKIIMENISRYIL